jgi:hypothetical protein
LQFEIIFVFVEIRATIAKVLYERSRAAAAVAQQVAFPIGSQERCPNVLTVSIRVEVGTATVGHNIVVFAPKTDVV